MAFSNQPAKQRQPATQPYWLKRRNQRLRWHFCRRNGWLPRLADGRLTAAAAGLAGISMTNVGESVIKYQLAKMTSVMQPSKMKISTQ